MDFEKIGSLSPDSLDRVVEDSSKLSTDSLDMESSKEYQVNVQEYAADFQTEDFKTSKEEQVEAKKHASDFQAHDFNTSKKEQVYAKEYASDFQADDYKTSKEEQVDDQECDSVIQKDYCKGQEDSAADFLDREVFPILLPAFEKMLFAAREHDVLKVQKSRFNGLDYLAELLWNRNPLHPEREGDYKTIFEIPFAKRALDENPRPVFPKSWLWSREEAAVVLQSAVRGFLVRARPEVQELRRFWRALALERRGGSDQTCSSRQSAP